MLITVDLPEGLEALKARKQTPDPNQMGFDFNTLVDDFVNRPPTPAPMPAPTPHHASHVPLPAPEARGLHLEQRQVGGHTQGVWVKPAEAPKPAEAAPAPAAPAPPPAPVVHEEVGEHVSGSRKDEAEPTGPAKTRKAILAADPTAVQRDDLLHAVAAKDAQAAGYSPGGHHLREYIRKTVSPEPFAGRSDNWQRKVGTWTDPAVRAEKFNQACAFLNRTFDKCKTAADFRTALREFTDLGRSSVENRAMFMALGERFSSLAMGVRTDGSRKALSEADALDAKGWPEASDATRSAGARKRFSFADIRGEEFDRVGGRPVARANAPQMAEDFGLRNVQFGEWLSQDDREHHLKAAHTAFFDLADVLGIDPKHVAMHNLSLAFGGRGTGFTGSGSAHYETDKKIINLTKFAGGGSLAHEWGHFLDNMLGGGEYGYGSMQGMAGLSPQAVAAFDQLGTAMYGDSWKHMKTNAAAVDKHNALAKAGDRGGAAVQKNIAAASASLIQSADSTQFARDAAELGGAVSRGDEMFARAFEAYVQDELHDAGRKNTYLVSGTRGVHLTPKLARRSRASIAAEHARHDEILKANPEYTAAKAKADTAQDAWSQALAEKHSAVGKAAKAAEAKANEAYSAWSAAMVASARLRRTLVPEVDPHHDGTEHPIYAQPYPQGAERQAINRAMRGFLAALRTSGEVYKALGSPAVIIYFPPEALKALAVANRPGLHLDPVRHRALATHESWHGPVEGLKARKATHDPNQMGFDFGAPATTPAPAPAPHTGEPPAARGLHLETVQVGGAHPHQAHRWMSTEAPLAPAGFTPAKHSTMGGHTNGKGDYWYPGETRPTAAGASWNEQHNKDANRDFNLTRAEHHEAQAKEHEALAGDSWEHRNAEVAHRVASEYYRRMGDKPGVAAFQRDAEEASAAARAADARPQEATPEPKPEPDTKEKAPEASASQWAGWSDEEMIQYHQDVIQTRREQGGTVPQAWIDGLAALQAKKQGRSAGVGVASMPVFGHPEATHLEADKYANLIPFHAADKETVVRFLRRAESILVSLNERVSKAEWEAKSGKTAAVRKKATEYLASYQGQTDATASDLLRKETIPELNRLWRAAPAAAPQGPKLDPKLATSAKMGDKVTLTTGGTAVTYTRTPSGWNEFGDAKDKRHANIDASHMAKLMGQHAGTHAPAAADAPPGAAPDAPALTEKQAFDLSHFGKYLAHTEAHPSGLEIRVHHKPANTAGFSWSVHDPAPEGSRRAPVVSTSGAPAHSLDAALKKARRSANDTHAHRTKGTHPGGTDTPEAAPAEQAKPVHEMSMDEYKKAFPATRNFQQYDHNQRADMAANFRMGHQARLRTGEHFYTHPHAPNIAFDTPKAAYAHAYAKTRQVTSGT